MLNRSHIDTDFSIVDPRELLSALAILPGVGVSVIVGPMFESYPAIKAAALEPIDALRYE